jgi:hypothetical protein
MFFSGTQDVEEDLEKQLEALIVQRIQMQLPFSLRRLIDGHTQSLFTQGIQVILVHFPFK